MTWLQWKARQGGERALGVRPGRWNKSEPPQEHCGPACRPALPPASPMQQGDRPVSQGKARGPKSPQPRSTGCSSHTETVLHAGSQSSPQTQSGAGGGSYCSLQLLLFCLLISGGASAAADREPRREAGGGRFPQASGSGPAPLLAGCSRQSAGSRPSSLRLIFSVLSSPATQQVLNNVSPMASAWPTQGRGR